MADEKKAVNKEVASKAAKVEKKKDKKPSKFSPKNVGKAIARFFKDLKGEIKKIIWPGRQMVIKSTGVVLASILVIGAGIWVLDYALSGAVTGITKAAESVTTESTEAADSTDDSEEADVTDEDSDETSADTTEEETSSEKADA